MESKWINVIDRNEEVKPHKWKSHKIIVFSISLNTEHMKYVFPTQKNKNLRKFN